MFDAAIEKLRAPHAKPFFAALLSGTNHGPWFVPQVPFGALPDTVADAQRFNAFKYSDWALGRFLRQLMTDSAFANTIVLVTGDHGLLIDPTYDLDLSMFQVPLLILDNRLRAGEPRRVSRLGSQVDILSTVMNLLQLDYDNYTFGHDLLRNDLDSSDDYVIFSEGYKVGIVNRGQYAIIRQEGRGSLYDLNDPLRDQAPLMPERLDSLTNQALSYFQSAYFNLQLPLRPNPNLGRK